LIIIGQFVREYRERVEERDRCRRPHVQSTEIS
jgi:hypothetical protein